MLISILLSGRARLGSRPVIDHLVLATPDVEATVDWLAGGSGCGRRRAAGGARHPSITAPTGGRLVSLTRRPSCSRRRRRDAGGAGGVDDRLDGRGTGAARGRRGTGRHRRVALRATWGASRCSPWRGSGRAAAGGRSTPRPASRPRGGPAGCSRRRGGR